MSEEKQRLVCDILFFFFSTTFKVSYALSKRRIGVMRFWYQVKQSVRKFESLLKLIVSIKLESSLHIHRDLPPHLKPPVSHSTNKTSEATLSLETQRSALENDSGKFNASKYAFVSEE